MWIESEHMLTVPEPSCEQRAKYARNYRRFAVAWLIIGVSFIAIGTSALLMRRADAWYNYFNIFMGVFWIFSAWGNYKRARKWAA